jgi:PAS domain S-box-containing protein
MKDQAKTKQTLIGELASLRKRIAQLEQSESERKQIEEALKESEERLRLIADNMSDMIRVTDLKGVNLFVSPSHNKGLGYTPDEREGKSVFEIVHPDDLEKVIKTFSEGLAAKRRASVEYRARHADGHYVWLDTVGDLFLDAQGDIKAIVMSSRDVSDRKRTENDLRESEEIYTRLINTIPDIIIRMDLDGKILFVNDNALRFSGYLREEILGRNMINFIAFEDRNRAIQNTFLMMERRLGPQEYRLIMKDGREIPFEVNGDVLRNEDGTPFGLVNVCRDISERKQVEEALRTSENRYYKLFEHMNSGVAIYEAVEDGADFAIRGFNTAAERLEKTTREEIIGRRVTEVFPGVIDFGLFSVFQRVWKTGNSEDHDISFYRDNRISGWRENHVYKLPTGEIVAIYNDVTNRKQAEIALQESEEKYRTLFENAGEAIFVAQDGKLAFLNPMTVTITGYSGEEISSRPFVDFIHENDRDMVLDRYVRRLKGENIPRRYSFRVIHKKGDLRWVELDTVLINWKGKPATLNFLIDITERKRVENILEESERELKALFKSMLNAFVLFESVFDQNGNFVSYRFVYINDAYERITGVKNDEVKGKTVHDVWPKTEASWVKAYGDVATTGVPSSFDMYHEPTGKLYHCNVYRPWDTKDRFCVVFEDITDRKRAEEEIQRTNTLLNSIVENIPNMIFLKDARELRFTRFNRAGEELLGHSRGDLLGKNDYDFFPKEQADFFVQKDREVLRGKEIVDIDEEPIQTRDKGERILHTKKVPILNAEGEPEYLMGISEDITDRKQAEAEKRRLEERLRRAEKMEALGQLAGGVAHDLNNVLGVLSGYSELLLAEIPEGQKARKHVEKILQSTEKGAAIIQDLLTLARRGVLSEEVIQVNEIVSGFIKTPAFESIRDYHPRVTFRTECDPHLLNIKGSPVHLEKTLMNLVSNAAEAISGEGEVVIRTENRYLDKAIVGYDEVREGDYTVLTVSDTGAGIADEHREKIFEPFYTKKAMGRSGTGLGLSIVWGTVKDHNGYIDVQTKIGAGTSFTLYFPATREETGLPTPRTPLERYMGRGESVLVVDDIAEQRDVASGLLKKLGYNVHTVSSGEAALEYLKRNRADILLLDMIMAPGMDGMETYRKVLEIHPKQKAILVSGFSETDRVHKAQRLGAGVYVKKPYVMETIGLAIRKELDRC